MKRCVTHHYACDCREAHFAELERENAALREIIADALDASVDARTYPDGPNLPKDIRDAMRAALNPETKQVPSEN